MANRGIISIGAWERIYGHSRWRTVQLLLSIAAFIVLAAMSIAWASGSIFASQGPREFANLGVWAACALLATARSLRPLREPTYTLTSHALHVARDGLVVPLDDIVRVVPAARRDWSIGGPRLRLSMAGGGRIVLPVGGLRPQDREHLRHRLCAMSTAEVFA